MAINRLERSIREFQLPFMLGIGGHQKVRELQALRALHETPLMATPEDQQYLSDLGHVEVAPDGARLSLTGRRRLADLENLVNSVIRQKNSAPNRNAPPAGALSGLPDPEKERDI